ncbi:type VI secretion protein [Pseudomonas sp. MBLB4136]|uniref:type VI secretion protein n=1 Tax=Pseudomonas sp. MBLB4136 TaxID=3451558 RepID=UPI003F755949
MNPRRRVFRSLSLLLASLALLTGCTFFVATARIDSLTLEVAPQANNGVPLAVDFVAVRDPALLQRLSQISARQWFAEREHYRREAGQLLEVWSLELVPGQFMESSAPPLAGSKAAELLVFASYDSPGAHRLRLAMHSRVWLRFESREMRLLDE